MCIVVVVITLTGPKPCKKYPEDTKGTSHPVPCVKTDAVDQVTPQIRQSDKKTAVYSKNASKIGAWLQGRDKPISYKDK